jgi:hypothetical protein
VAPTDPSDVPTDVVPAVADPVGSDVPTDVVPAVGDPMAPPAAVATAEVPVLFDGHDDLIEYPPAREPFRVRVIFVLSVFATLAGLLVTIADVVDIRTTRPASGIATGVQTLEDLGSNLGLAVFAGMAAMVIGGLLACFGLRWGAGLAGGGGLAVVGWAALGIGLAEVPIAVAQEITRTSSEEFTLRVTRDVGWWLIVGIGVVGFLVFALSLRWVGTGGRRPLQPLVAAATAVGALVLACGPLIPVGTATFADNVRSTDGGLDLPAAFFAGRLTQVAIIAIAGVVGMLIVRTWGLGLAAGGLPLAAVLWITSLLDAGARPIGIAVANPGADDTAPHAVTTAGIVATALLLLVAAVLAIVRWRRHPA